MKMFVLGLILLVGLSIIAYGLDRGVTRQKEQHCVNVVKDFVLEELQRDIGEDAKLKHNLLLSLAEYAKKICKDE